MGGGGGGGGKWGELCGFLWEGRAENEQHIVEKRELFWGNCRQNYYGGGGGGWTNALHAPPGAATGVISTQLSTLFWSHSVLKLNPPSQIIINSTPKYESSGLNHTFKSEFQ